MSHEYGRSDGSAVQHYECRPYSPTIPRRTVSPLYSGSVHDVVLSRHHETRAPRRQGWDDIYGREPRTHDEETHPKQPCNFRAETVFVNCLIKGSSASSPSIGKSGEIVAERAAKSAPRPHAQIIPA